MSHHSLSIRAYAKRRGVSHQAVMKAIAGGRLDKSLERKDGGVKIADPELADLEWAWNTDLSRATDDIKSKAAAAVGAGVAAAAADQPTAVVEHLEPQAHGGALKRTTSVDAEDVEDEPPTLADWSTEEKQWRAKAAKLKYEQAAGRLVNADAVTSKFIDSIVTCRTKLLGIPTKAKHAIPHLSIDEIAVLDRLVRESLEELAGA